METTQHTQSRCYQTKFLANNQRIVAAIPKWMHWTELNWWWFLFNILLQSCHRTQTYVLKQKGRQAWRPMNTLTFFAHFKTWLCSLFVSSRMAQSNSNQTDGNTLQTRQTAVATRALCSSFDLAAIFLTLYQFGCFLFVCESLSLKPNAQHFLLPHLVSWFILSRWLFSRVKKIGNNCCKPYRFIKALRNVHIFCNRIILLGGSFGVARALMRFQRHWVCLCQNQS